MEPLGLRAQVRGSDHVQLILIGVLGIRAGATTTPNSSGHASTCDGLVQRVEANGRRRDSQAGRVVEAPQYLIGRNWR